MRFLGSTAGGLLFRRIRVLLALLTGLSTYAAFADAVRPNILWITCEDMSPNLGCYGDPVARTPNIDRLAQEGLRYEKAFSVSGVCAPSRSCLITGMYPTSLGTLHMRCRNQPPEPVKCFPEYLREAGYYCTNNQKEDYNFNTPASAWDESSGKAHYRNRPDPDQPFFAVFNFTITHESSIGTLPEDLPEKSRSLLPATRTDPAAVTLPGYFPDTPVLRRYWAHYHDLIAAMDRQVGQVLADLEADGLAENTIVFFFSDHGAGVPRSKRWLYDSGTRVPLVMRHPGVIPPGAVTDRLVSFVDFAPTVLSLAGVPIPPHMQESAFSGPQEGPPREGVFAARDRMDERHEIIRAVRDARYRYIRNYRPELPYDQYLNYPESFPLMQEWRRAHSAGETDPKLGYLFGRSKPLEELYDLENDPFELNNLVDAPDLSGVLARLRRSLDAWMSSTGDVGFLPELALADWLGDRTDHWTEPRSLPRPDGTAPDIHGRTAEDWIEQIERGDRTQRLQAAASLGFAGPAILPTLLALLEDPDPAVAYWAGIGLGRWGGESPEIADTLRKALQSPDPARSLGAARGLILSGLLEEALPAVISRLDSPNEYERLEAAQLLEPLAADHPAAADALRSHLEDASKYVVRCARHGLGLEPLR